MGDPPAVVDVDAPSTWPPAVFEHAQLLAERSRGITDYTNELSVFSDDEDSFRALLAGYLVRAYHATRLLDHEVQMIRAQGLRPLSAELVKDRIDYAFEHSCISAEDRDLLHLSHVFAAGEEQYRVGKCCLFLSECMLVDEPAGIIPLLESWGGEAMWKATRNTTIRALVRRLGRPSIVVANIDLCAGEKKCLVFPELCEVFHRHLPNRKLNPFWTDVHYFSAIPPADISAIWQPGDAEYDRFEDLPAS